MQKDLFYKAKWAILHRKMNHLAFCKEITQTKR